MLPYMYSHCTLQVILPSTMYRKRACQLVIILQPQPKKELYTILKIMKSFAMNSPILKLQVFLKGFHGIHTWFVHKYKLYGCMVMMYRSCMVIWNYLSLLPVHVWAMSTFVLMYLPFSVMIWR